MKNVSETILFIVGLAYFIYAMNCKIDDEIRYYIYLRSSSIFMSIMLFLYLVNCKLNNLRILVTMAFIASLWHVKDICIGKPYTLGTVEIIFIIIIIISTIILLFRHGKKDELRTGLFK